jgi:hypothetical protein
MYEQTEWARNEHLANTKEERVEFERRKKYLDD